MTRDLANQLTEKAIEASGDRSFIRACHANWELDDEELGLGFQDVIDESVMFLADMGLTGRVSLHEWRWEE